MCIPSDHFSSPAAASLRNRRFQCLMATGKTLGLATEIMHDAAQLLDRATCLGLLPTALRYSAGSSTPELEDTLVDAEISAEGILYSAAIFIACQSRANFAPCALWKLCWDGMYTLWF